MKTYKNYLLAILFFIILSCFSIPVSAETYSGTGWTLDTETGELTITGDLSSWSSYSAIPWHRYKSYITSVYAEEGSSAQTLYYAFAGCTNLTTVDLENLDVSAVTDMRGAFSYCSAMTSCSVSSWDTSNVVYMGGSSYYTINSKSCYGGMFYNCSSLTSLDVSG